MQAIETNTYTFGDDDRAADRLTLLARAFAPSSHEFLDGLGAAGEPLCAVDLGCGLAHTTELLTATVAAGSTVGLEASPRLLARARARAPWLELYRHDVTRAPFPVGGIELLYGRFLLTHLSSPVAALEAWSRAACPNARLALEETAELRSEDPVFARYYELVAALQRHHGQDAQIGARLDAVAERARFRVEHFEVTPLRLEAKVMARLHSMNVRAWRTDEHAARAFDPRELDALTEALDAVAEGARAAPDVMCGLGRLIARAPA
jgi:SAM-dependent methyltransferase